MAPEQWIDRANGSTAVDVYNTGCLFVFLATGHWPFESNDTAELARCHISEPAKSSVAVKQLPQPLRPLLECMLSKAPRERRPAGAIHAELSQVAESLKVAKPTARKSLIAWWRNLRPVPDERPGKSLDSDFWDLVESGEEGNSVPVGFVKVANGSLKGQMRALVYGRSVTIGRLAECDLAIRDDPSVSRKHCQLAVGLRATGLVCRLNNLGANGTYVNGRRVDDEAVVQHGDVVEVGASTRLIVNLRGVTDPMASEPTAMPSPLQDS
jgi:hypothetical protein